MIKATYLGSSNYFKHLIGHEAGHAFGLHHTFRGTGYKSGCSNRGDFSASSASDPCKTYGGCIELVDNTVIDHGSITNGEHCGDKIPDTPADPNTWSGGVYNEIVTENGVSYAPIADNIMNYNHAINTTQLTDDQAYVCNRWAARINGFGIAVESYLNYPSTTVCGYVNEILYTNGIYPPNGIGTWCGHREEYVPPMWEITNTNGNVSIDQDGKITVNNSTYGSETVTLNYRWWENQGGYYTLQWRTVTKTVLINPSPDAPYVSMAWDVDAEAYTQGPILTGTDYGLLMYCSGYPTPCTSTDTDHQWVSSVWLDGGMYDFGLRGYVVNSKWCYFNLFDEGTYTFKARYRELSTSPYSSWSTKQLTFESGMMMMMSPNPVMVSTSVISLESTSSVPLDYNEGWEIEVVNIGYGKKIKEKVKKKDYKLKTHGWKAGTYIVVAKYKDKQVTGKLKVE